MPMESGRNGFSFYRCCVRCSPYSRMGWPITWFQPRYRCVYFFITFWIARYGIFAREASFGNTLLFFVAFRYRRFTTPMIFVVCIIFLNPLKKERTGLSPPNCPSSCVWNKGIPSPRFLSMSPALPFPFLRLGDCRLLWNRRRVPLGRCNWCI